MTYSNVDPRAMNRPDSPLADKRWRMINSWWILPPILSCGFLGWLGFFVAGVRTGKRIYWICTAIYAALFALFFVLITLEGVWADIAMVPFLTVWIAPTVHAAILNRGYLRELASQDEWYASPAKVSGPGVNQADPTVLGVSTHDYYGSAAPSPTPPTAPMSAPTPPPPIPYQGGQSEQVHHSRGGEQQGSINVNRASHADLSAVPGVSDSLAQRIIAIRDARGGYRDIDDLAAAANLQPHELVRLRDAIVFAEPNSGERQLRDYGNSGRILDI